MTPETVSGMDSLGVTVTQDYAWQYKGQLRSPLAEKKAAMTRFAETYVAG